MQENKICRSVSQKGYCFSTLLRRCSLQKNHEKRYEGELKKEATMIRGWITKIYLAVYSPPWILA